VSDEWICPNCGKYHSTPHYRNWRNGPLYCPHCGWEDFYTDSTSTIRFKVKVTSTTSAGTSLWW